MNDALTAMCALMGDDLKVCLHASQGNWLADRRADGRYVFARHGVPVQLVVTHRG